MTGEDQTPQPALVLAGGRGIRLGGNKPMRRLGGQPLIAHVLARLTPHCTPIAISAPSDAPELQGLGFPCLPDADDTRPGPLAGILAGLDHFAAAATDSLSNSTAWLMVAPADAPFLPEDLVPRLRRTCTESGAQGPVLATSAGQLHPTIGLWPLAARGAIRSALAAGEFRATALARTLGATSLDWPIGSEGDPFFNVNTPEDLLSAELRWAGGDHVLDLCGLKCPLPALKTEKRLKTLQNGAVLRVLCTDPMAAIDIPHLAQKMGVEVLGMARVPPMLLFRLKRPD